MGAKQSKRRGLLKEDLDYLLGKILSVKQMLEHLDLNKKNIS